MVSLYLYQLLSLTDYPSQDMPWREEMGWGLVMTVVVSAIINFVKFLYLVISTTRLVCNRKKVEKHKKYLEEKKNTEA
jgi:hypothetical protein